jgi:hypothetical protein
MILFKPNRDFRELRDQIRGHMRRFMVLVSPLLFMSTAHAANAQEPGQVGLTFGLPASFGLVARVDTHFTLRPKGACRHLLFQSDRSWRAQ